MSTLSPKNFAHSLFFDVIRGFFKLRSLYEDIIQNVEILFRDKKCAMGTEMAIDNKEEVRGLLKKGNIKIFYVMNYRQTQTSYQIYFFSLSEPYYCRKDQIQRKISYWRASIQYEIHACPFVHYTTATTSPPTSHHAQDFWRFSTFLSPTYGPKTLLQRKCSEINPLFLIFNLRGQIPSSDWTLTHALIAGVHFVGIATRRAPRTLRSKSITVNISAFNRSS